MNLTCIEQKVETKKHVEKKEVLKKQVTKTKVPVKKKIAKVTESVEAVKQLKSLKPSKPSKPSKTPQPVKPAKVIQTKKVEDTPLPSPIVEKKQIMSEKELYLKNNLYKIAALIQENLYYPRRARKRGIQGSVSVRFMLHKDGTVTQITTISSNSGVLTRAAIKTIAELSGKFPKPNQKMVLVVPINYRLND